jgi:hypothetical protein
MSSARIAFSITCTDPPATLTFLETSWRDTPKQFRSKPGREKPEQDQLHAWMAVDTGR